MNAPMTRDPLAVTTSDGTAWTRRAVTRGGRGLYAPEGVTGCPQFVMATLEELAEHGIQGREAVAGPSECERLRAQVAELLAERHSTNDALGELEQQRAAALVGHVRYEDSEHCLSDGEPWPCPTVRALGSGRATDMNPWQRATDGLNALVDAGIPFHVEPDGHISNPLGDEHIEYDRATERWRLVLDEGDEPVPYVLTESIAPSVVTSAALAAAEKLRRDLPLELPGGERP